jgi:phosphopantothenoylcysteine decarboxylase
MARIVIGVTGSVAAIRVPALVEALRNAGHDARVVTTEPALYFFDPEALPLPVEDAGPPIGSSALFRDADEWPRRAERAPAWGVYEREDFVLHIELRRWAELLLIAPLDANTLAKLAYGLCDNLLTSLCRAWDLDRPILLAPAMNTFMWESPLTQRQLRLLLEIHGGGAASEVEPIGRPPGRPPGEPLDALLTAINERCPHLGVCPPQSKRLACGDVGIGAIADVDVIVDAVTEALR